MRSPASSTSSQDSKTPTKPPGAGDKQMTEQQKAAYLASLEAGGMPAKAGMTLGEHINSIILMDYTNKPKPKKGLLSQINGTSDNSRKALEL